MVIIRQREREQLTGTGLLLALFISTVLGNDKSDTDAVKMTDEDRLLEELFKRRHYNPDSRPAERADEVVAIEFEINPIQLMEIDYLNEVMRILIWIKMKWTDFRLVWNESDYNGLSHISVPCSKIWRPDFILTNSAEKWTELAKVNIVVSSDGSCRWRPPMMAVSFCLINIQWFPFDEQNCSLEFESWTYNVSDLNIATNNASICTKYYETSSEWDLVDFSTANSTVHGDHAGHEYHDHDDNHDDHDDQSDDEFLSPSHIIFNFRWKRRPLYYNVNMILPCTLLFLISAVTYLIPPQEGDRISLGITTLLAMGLHQLIIADRVPPTSDAVPLIGIYFTSMVTMNSLSLMAMIAIYNLYYRSSTNTHPPKWLYSRVKRLGKWLRKTEPTHNRQMEQSTDSSVARSKETNEASEGVPLTERARRDIAAPHRPVDEESEHWKYVALVIDRLCFCVYIICSSTIMVVFFICAVVARYK